MTEATPKGITAIYTDKAGQVTAHASDFDTFTRGGNLRDAQEYRARFKLYREMVKAYCNEPMRDVITGYQADEIARAMPGEIIIIPVGWDE